MKREGLLIFIITIIFTINVFASGINVSETHRLPTGKIIEGEDIDYSIVIPMNWRDYVVVEREIPKPNSNFSDRINIYYKPDDSTIDRLLFVSAYIYEKDKWSENTGYRKISESDDHILVLYVINNNPFQYGRDNLIFSQLLKEASNDLFTKSYFTLGDKKETENTVYANGRALIDPVYPVSTIAYIPVREACENLGFTVEWRDSDKSITISDANIYTRLSFRNRTSIKYPLINKEGKAYVASSYFLQILKCNVEIDNKSNVKITR